MVFSFGTGYLSLGTDCWWSETFLTRSQGVGAGNVDKEQAQWTGTEYIRTEGKARCGKDQVRSSDCFRVVR